jgi:hypothetical protein
MKESAVSRWQCARQSPSLDNQSAFLGASASTRIHCPAMHHSHIRVLLCHPLLRASPHAGNQPRQRVCALGASPAPSHTAARAQNIRVSDVRKGNPLETYLIVCGPLECLAQLIRRCLVFCDVDLHGVNPSSYVEYAPERNIPGGL